MGSGMHELSEGQQSSIHPVHVPYIEIHHPDYISVDDVIVMACYV